MVDLYKNRRTLHSGGLCNFSFVSEVKANKLGGLGLTDDRNKTDEL